jgi:hypothetical protein
LIITVWRRNSREKGRFYDESKELKFREAGGERGG